MTGLGVRLFRAVSALTAAAIVASACAGGSDDEVDPPSERMAIGNVHKTAGAFPPDWTITRNPTTTVTAEMIEQNFSPPEGQELHVQVNPEACAADLDNIGAHDGLVGQVVESFTATSPDGIVVSVSAARLPDNTTAPLPPAKTADCRYVTFDSPGILNGIATPADEPYIADVKVRATHVVTNYDDGSDRVTDQYTYLSALDARRVLVTMMVSVGPAAENLPRIDTHMTRQIYANAVNNVQGG